MANDLELIKELEKEIGRELPRLNFSDIMDYNTLGYAADKQGRVTALNLERMEIKVIPAVLSRFQHLEKLKLSGNQISDISPLAGLKNMTTLYLRSNQISDISPLADLSKLTDLVLESNQISDISPLAGLTELEYLNLERNQISDIKPLAKLTKLTNLVLDNNQISDISPLAGLTNLTTLWLKSNQISDISHLTKLPNLNRLKLTGNKITALPRQILDLNLEFDVEKGYAAEDKIYLYGNPLQQPPPEIIKQGRERLRAYFQTLEKEKQLPLQEVKVLLVGDGGAGKTSLVKRILGRDFDANEAQTHGINIDNWQVKTAGMDITVHLWDFGGQEIMHATHQFFLSKRSLYILVLDGRRDDKTEYWLKHIESFGGDSPVLVVINKMDQNPGFDVNRPFLKQNYPGIRGFFPVSCAKNKGIDTFKVALIEQLARVELIRTTWPESWFNIKKELEEMPDHYINYGDYERMCREKEIEDREKQALLVEFLHDLGVMLHFKDVELEHTQVLRPEWVTDAVYRIINSGELSNSKGVLDLRMLDTILKKREDDDFDYPRDKYRYITGLMEKFQLCYPLQSSSTWLVPDLLAVPEPEFAFAYETALRFIIEYDFLPRSVLPRFIVNMYKDIKENLQWRTGVVLEDRDFRSAAVVKADYRLRRIYIYVNGSQKRDYFAALLLTLRRINDSFEKLKTSELVPMPDNPEITAPYKQLVKNEKKGYEYFLHADSDKEYPVKELLGTITGDKAVTEEEILRLLKKIAADTDTKESLAKKLNDSVILQPGILGVRLDINKIINKFLSRKKNKKSA